MNAEMTTAISNKGNALLRFLKDFAAFRRQRIPEYKARDKVLWFAEIPKDRRECLSPFVDPESQESWQFWLEVRKTAAPVRPPVPEEIVDWIRPEDLDLPTREPDLLPEITVLVEKEILNPDERQIILEKVPEVRRLEEHPEVEDRWLEYFLNDWGPWAQKMLRWQEVHRVYESMDFMRRRLEESEEQYELFLGLGLLLWRDSRNMVVKRHLLTGPAEIEFDAARGVITVIPAATFESFRVELDMLEPEDQPRLGGTSVEGELEELDIRAWDRDKVGEILREISNLAKGDSQVDEEPIKPVSAPDGTFRVYFAPAVVLRERRSSSLEEILRSLLEKTEAQSVVGSTGPWERFLSEGQSIGPYHTPPNVPDSEEPGGISSPVRYYFPLPTNEEQSQIIYRHSATSCVVVKGPPGTGKSHTIANLICHLLASGERILITAQAPKALTVLREKLPIELQDLCITALGSTREDQRLLEQGVSGILRRQNEWRGSDWALERIEELEEELGSLEKELAQTERQLRESREAEAYSHTLSVGYEGTAVHIARQLDQERETLGWFPEVLSGQPACPLEDSEVRLLAEVHAKLSPEVERGLRLDTGEFSLLDPDEFRGTLMKLKDAVRSEKFARQKADPEKLAQIHSCSDETLGRTASAIHAIDERSARSAHILGSVLEELLMDLSIGRVHRWRELREQAEKVLARINTALQDLRETRVRVPMELRHESALEDAQRRLEHFAAGGGRGVLFLKPQVIRETAYLEERCLINGRPPDNRDRLWRLVAFLEVTVLIGRFKQLWPGRFNYTGQNPAQAAFAAGELLVELGRFVTFSDEFGEDPFQGIPALERDKIASTRERASWLSTIAAELATRHKQAAMKPLAECYRRIRRCLDTKNAHPCLQRLAQALEKLDPAAWEVAWKERENVRRWQGDLAKYKQALMRIAQLCPELEVTLRKNQGRPEWKARLFDLKKAWAWAAARGWLSEVCDRNRFSELIRTSHRLQAKVEKKIEEIAALRAWHAFFSRLDDTTIQYLKAWTDAVDRIGAGTGPYAHKHRRTARNYLMACIPKIPAWIMPLHKLWDTVDAESGLFDTIIIDEASQAGTDSLALLLLAKKIIVVGDDKQNTPEAAFVRDDDIARLVREHLGEFRFREEFRPDTSFFDHAERAFGNVISLREHFRCVPEIIRFSNDLCYTDAPLIPLRQAPPRRLPPLRATYVDGGFCKGERQEVYNLTEAEELVKTILECLEADAYEDKTIGVIALQGRAQAEVVASKLAEAVDPKILSERKLRCGVPATFQGDQRDVMFLSLVMAPNVPHQPLTRLPFVRRFNVAMSRGCDQVWLFHSMKLHDLSQRCLRRRLLSFFEHRGAPGPDDLGEDRDRLEREARRALRRPGEQPEPYESWFEVDVALELLRRGYRIRPQYEVAGKRIDIVVEGHDLRLAVECDGEAWHGPEHYAEDMARQRQLERLNWNFVQVRESEFYADRTRAIEEVMRECDQLGIHPIGISEESETMDEEAVATAEEPVQQFDEGLVDDEGFEDFVSSEEGPFTGYSPDLGFPDPRQASTSNVRAALRKIVQKDGPLTRSSVYRLYEEGCPHIERVGKAVRQSLNVALGTMLRAAEIVQEDELGSRSPRGLTIRLVDTPRVRERPAGRRDLLEIPPSELKMVLERLQKEIPGDAVNAEETLFRKILDHYGYGRLTLARRKYLRRLLRFSNTQKTSNRV